MNGSRPSRSALVVGFLGALFVGGVGGAMIGFVVGIAVGWKVAFHEMDGASEVLFDRQQGDTAAPEFWVVVFDASDNPMLLPLDHVHDLEDGWSLRMPSSAEPRVVGLWENNMPAGNHPFDAGGILDTDVNTDIVNMVVYRSDVEGGWRRFYYDYQVTGDTATPLLVKRERNFNDFGAMMVGGFAIYGTAIGALAFGVLTPIAYLILWMARRRLGGS